MLQSFLPISNTPTACTNAKEVPYSGEIPPFIVAPARKWNSRIGMSHLTPPLLCISMS